MTQPPPYVGMNDVDKAALRVAAEQLEGRSFAMTLAARVGMPVERLLRLLPERAQGAVGGAVSKALEQCLRVALTMGNSGTSLTSRRSHTAMTAVTGAVGGFFGLPGLAIELPVTTTVMLHSIAEIARANGEDLSTPESALACLQVLALGPDGRVSGEALESAYYATRAALAQVTRDAAAYVAEKGMAKEGAPVLISFLAKIAARFGVEVSEKAAAQLVPVAGAVGGLALNVLFTNYFQRLAEGHFTVRRLERKYGAELVRQEYGIVRGV
jgi:histone H3/H4